jgi:hypothetical protein
MMLLRLNVCSSPNTSKISPVITSPTPSANIRSHSLCKYPLDSGGEFVERTNLRNSRFNNIGEGVNIPYFDDLADCWHDTHGCSLLREESAIISGGAELSIASKLLLSFAMSPSARAALLHWRKKVSRGEKH